MFFEYLSMEVRGSCVAIAPSASVDTNPDTLFADGVFGRLASGDSSVSSGQTKASFVLVYTLIESTIVTPDESTLGPTEMATISFTYNRRIRYGHSSKILKE